MVKINTPTQTQIHLSAIPKNKTCRLTRRNQILSLRQNISEREKESERNRVLVNGREDITEPTSSGFQAAPPSAMQMLKLSLFHKLTLLTLTEPRKTHKQITSGSISSIKTVKCTDLFFTWVYCASPWS